MASPEDIVESLNKVMMKVAGMKNYIKAGKIQEEVQNLTKLQEDMNEAAAELDFITAGKLQKVLVEKSQKAEFKFLVQEAKKCEETPEKDVKPKRSKRKSSSNASEEERKRKREVTDIASLQEEEKDEDLEILKRYMDRNIEDDESKLHTDPAVSTKPKTCNPLQNKDLTQKAQKAVHCGRRKRQRTQTRFYSDSKEEERKVKAKENKKKVGRSKKQSRQNDNIQTEEVTSSPLEDLDGPERYMDCNANKDNNNNNVYPENAVSFLLQRRQDEENEMPKSITAIIRYMDELEPTKHYYRKQQDTRGECSGTRGKLREFARAYPTNPAIRHWIETKKWQPPNNETLEKLVALLKKIILKEYKIVRKNCWLFF